MGRSDNAIDDWAETLATHRPRLVRLCGQLTHDPDSAEDLAQETLYEAWRHLGKLHDPQGLDRWLSAIARNVCRRWVQRHGHEPGYHARFVEAEDAALEAGTLEVDGDLDFELERTDLAHLLDRAMALLPSQTRHVLVGRYVEEWSQAEIARRLHLSEGVVEARMQRGKVALRRVLATTLQQEVAAFAFIDPGMTWQVTRMWCPLCGHRRLMGRFSADHTGLELRCPTCCESPTAFVVSACRPELFRDVKGFKPAYTRLLARHGASLGPRGGPTSCVDCGGPVHLHCSVEPYAWWARPSFRQRCTRCGRSWDFTMSGFLLALPVGRQFWKRHPRLRSLPVRDVEAVGVPSLVATLEDVTGQARLEVVCARDTLAVSSVHV